jgi:hypothetical protein
MNSPCISRKERCRSDFRMVFDPELVGSNPRRPDSRPVTPASPDELAFECFRNQTPCGSGRHDMSAPVSATPQDSAPSTLTFYGRAPGVSLGMRRHGPAVRVAPDWNRIHAERRSPPGPAAKANCHQGFRASQNAHWVGQATLHDCGHRFRSGQVQPPCHRDSFSHYGTVVK